MTPPNKKPPETEQVFPPDHSQDERRLKQLDHLLKELLGAPGELTIADLKAAAQFMYYVMHLRNVPHELWAYASHELTRLVCVSERAQFEAAMLHAYEDLPCAPALKNALQLTAEELAEIRQAVFSYFEQIKEMPGFWVTKH
jgi:hypothetical protein